MIKNKAIHQAAIGYCLSLPYSQALGVRYELTAEKEDVFIVDWREDLVLDRQTQTLHNGVMIALIDVAGGVAVSGQLEDVQAVVTLDMRIDYLSAVLAKQNIKAQATCLRIEKQIAFVNIVCFHDVAKAPIAIGTATYMCTPVPKELKEKFL